MPFGPAPRWLPGSGPLLTETFTWSCVESGTGTGTLSVLALAAGTDAVSGAAVATTSPASAAKVQEAALLSVAVQTPSAVSRGQGFTVSAVVTNAGGAIAQGVRVTAQTLGSGGAGTAPPIAPPAADIAAGASATFFFAYVENGGAPGTLTFQMAAAGTDAISGGTVSSSGTSSAMPVLTPASLAISSFILVPTSIQRGQTFAAKVTGK